MFIKAKIITVISLAIILAVGATTVILLRVQGKKMLDTEINNTEFIGDIISKSIEEDMATGDTMQVQQTIEHIGESKGIMSLRILSPDGTILKSKNSAEIGSKARDFMLSSSRQKTSKPYIVDERMINYFNPVQNRQECFGCHPATQSTIGIIQIKQDISQNAATMLSLKRLLAMSIIITVLIVSLTLSLLFSNLIFKPLKRLLATIKDIEGGNLQATVNIDSNDEIGFIGQSFNKMISEINRLYQTDISREREMSKIKVELEHKNKVEDLNSMLEIKLKELETANRAITSLSKEIKGKNLQLEKAVARLKKINEIGRMLTSIIETEELMKIIIRTTAGLIDAEKITLYLNKIHKPSMTIQYKRGIGIETLSDFTLEFNEAYADLLNNGRPLMIPSTTDSEDGGNNLNAPQIGVPLKMKGQIIGAMLLENKVKGDNFTMDELEILTTLANQAMVAIDNAWLYENVKSNYFSAMQSLVNALEANDRFTRGHSERVKLLSVELGRFMGLDYKEIEVLEQAAILHDIGKLGVDNMVLQKQGKLTPREFGLIQRHPLIGDEILRPIADIEGVRETIVQHHEHFDGTGYPFRLKGEELSLKARILSIADTFDAMMSNRPYRKAITLYDVKDELRTNAGTQFDPYVVNAFLEMIDSRGEKFLESIGYDSVQAVV